MRSSPRPLSLTNVSLARRISQRRRDARTRPRASTGPLHEECAAAVAANSKLGAQVSQWVLWRPRARALTRARQTRISIRDPLARGPLRRKSAGNEWGLAPFRKDEARLCPLPLRGREESLAAPSAANECAAGQHSADGLAQRASNGRLTSRDYDVEGDPTSVSYLDSARSIDACPIRERQHLLVGGAGLEGISRPRAAAASSVRGRGRRWLGACLSRWAASAHVYFLFSRRTGVEKNRWRSEEDELRRFDRRTLGVSAGESL